MTTQQKDMQTLWQGSFLGSGSEDYLEGLYEEYLAGAGTLAPEWKAYFDNLTQSMQRAQPDTSHRAIQEQFLTLAKHPGVARSEVTVDVQQERIVELITAYRRLGHLQAATDPLALREGVYSPSLELGYYGFTDNDNAKEFNVSSFTSLNKDQATLKEIHETLRKVYCSTIGFEYMHINRSEEVEWLRARIEQGWANFKLTDVEKKRILDRLIVADGLEKYLGFKYVGQKRFSLEGGDSLIPMLDKMVNRSVETGVKEIVIGMAHRGRLNVLANIVGKEPKAIFAAFDGTGIPETRSGDVKYHLGCSSNVVTPHGVVHISLAFNPSHLEIVSPVVQGSVRARQRRRKDSGQRLVMPIQIHGDAAFAGQGCVMETFNMSQARWFTVGGSIHIVINNQIGFTTSDERDARSTMYPTDVAKMVEAPILHVNTEDPEAVYFAALLAIDYRQTFKRDVVIDLVCYRRHGHNEADEPSATQPLMYQAIKKKQPAFELYAEKLQAEGVVDAQFTKQIADNYRNALDQGTPVIETTQDTSAYEFMVKWQPYLGDNWREPVVTGVALDKLKSIGAQLTHLPDGFVLQPQVKRMHDAMQKMATGEMAVNWGFAENMAYATLLEDGYPIRLCGQDSARGTFAHRHAVFHNQANNDVYIPLSHLSKNQAQINIVNSLLSEEAVLAFEYGYSTAEPTFLDIWEAQFGDFANGAQVVIDQFISSGEQKWERLCGLVMLLPHGYEGMGPEHSSARLERYLQLCAQENMQVCVPSTPSQIFHLLRRQMLRMYRKPLIIMSPKSFLRNPLAVSELSDLADGEFELFIPEIDDIDPKRVDRVVFCGGKIFYELIAERRERKLNNVAIIRIEQLYPFAVDIAKDILKPYKHVKDIVWCQEEPQNQGAWDPIIQQYFPQVLSKTQSLSFAGRPASASTAAGYHSVHVREQEKLINDALTIHVKKAK